MSTLNHCLKLVWCAGVFVLNRSLSLAFVRLTVLFCLVGVVPWVMPVFAQSLGGDEDSSFVLSSVRVKGNQRVEVETIRTYLDVKSGDHIDADAIDESLKRLFATGLFADVVITPTNGGGLSVEVVENPVINRVIFEGNRRVEDKSLRDAIQLRPRHVYTPSKVRGDVSRLLEVYRRSGRFAVTVDPKAIELEQNRVDLVFEINEGSSTYVQRINFVGNKRFSDGDLKEEIITREERWYRFLSSTDTYDPDRVSYDRELLRRFYLRKGYADFRVVSAVAELASDRSGFFITFTVEEGERYKLREQKVNSSLSDLDVTPLAAVLEGENGDWYNADIIQKNVKILTDRVGGLGYAFLDVRPRVRKNDPGSMIDVVYDIREGVRAYVDRINISGNVRTLDSVIRREMQLVEGDAFNADRLRRSRQRIRNLGFFEKVDVSTSPSERSSDALDLDVKVREKSTGNLLFGLGWSSSDGPLFKVSVAERNLLGKGQNLRLSATAAGRKQSIDFSFVEPRFLDRPLSAGLDVFVRERDRQRESSYDLKEIGTGLHVGFNYTEAWRQSLRYSLQETEVKNVKSTASPYIRGILGNGSVDKEGGTLLSMVGQTLSRDQRDSAVDPKQGYMVRLGTDIAGLGGDEKFAKATLDAQYYIPVTDDIVFVQKGMVGLVQGLGEDVRFIRNYYLGGSNLRGFKYGGASPRDKGTGDAFGGNWMATGSTELRFPLGLPEELGISGKVFSDYGLIGKPDSVLEAEMSSSSSPRLSVGVGIVWQTPIMALPLSMDFAWAILKEDFDKTETFRFNFGTHF